MADETEYTDEGIPLSLMHSPSERIRGSWSNPVAGAGYGTTVKSWRPPVYVGLNALARGIAGLTPLQDMLLVWQRSGEHKEIVLRAVASRVQGWNVELWQAEYIVRMSLLHAQWPSYRFTPLPQMSERKFRRLLREASGWITAELKIANTKIARAHSTLMSELELLQKCENRRAETRTVYYPTRGNLSVWKARRQDEESPCDLQKAA